MTIRIRIAVVLGVSTAFLGCGKSAGPELHDVAGTIKLNGQPLPQARVVFQPENGRPSRAVTDENGYYRLEYKSGTYGALPGKHTVTIRTFRETDPDADDPADREGAPEKVPAKYNAKTTLERTVAADRSDPIDFDLQSGGAIVTPDQEQTTRRRTSSQGCD